MKLGFIGLGNMASAIIGGILKKGLVTPEEILGSDKFPAAMQKAAEQLKERSSMIQNKLEKVEVVSYEELTENE